MRAVSGEVLCGVMDPPNPPNSPASECKATHIFAQDVALPDQTLADHNT